MSIKDKIQDLRDKKKKLENDPEVRGRTRIARLESAIDSLKDKMSSDKSGDSESDDEDEIDSEPVNKRSASGSTVSGARNDIEDSREWTDASSSESDSQSSQGGLMNVLYGANEVDPSEAMDDDFLSSSQGRVFENPAEMAVSRAGNPENINDDRQFTQFVRSKNFEDANENLEKARDIEENLEGQISTVFNSSSDARFVFGSGDDAETVSRDEALNRLQDRKDEIESSISSIEKNQDARLSNIIAGDSLIDRSDERSAETVAEEEDVDGVSVTFLNKDTGVDLEGKAADAFMAFDTVTSGGKESFNLIASTVTGDNPQDIAEEYTIRSGRNLQENGFQPLNEAGKTLTSAPGLLVSGAAAGKAFAYGTRALQSYGAAGNVAARGLQAGGLALAGAETARLGGKAADQAREGKDTEALGTGLQLGFELGGVAAGARSASKKLAGRLGSTETSQVNILNRVGDRSFTGQGRMSGRTNVVRPEFQRGNIEFQSPVARSGFRSPVKSFDRPGFRDSVKAVDVEGRYGIDAGESSASAMGALKVDGPDGVSYRDFESLQSFRGSTETRQGNKYVATRDYSDQEVEGRFFTGTLESSEMGGTVVENNVRGFDNFDASSFRDSDMSFLVRDRASAQKLDLVTRSVDGSTSGTAENLVLGSRPDTGSGSGSGSGRGVSAGSGSGGGQVEETYGIESVAEEGAAYTVDASSISRQQASNYLDRTGGGAAASSGNAMALSDGVETQESQQGQASQNMGQGQMVESVERPTFGSFEVQGNTQDSGQVASTAKELNQDFASTGSVSGQDFASNQGLGVRYSEDLSNVGRSGTELVPGQGQTQGQGLGVGSVQRPGLGLSQNQRIGPSTGLTQVPDFAQASLLRPASFQKFSNPPKLVNKVPVRTTPTPTPSGAVPVPGKEGVYIDSVQSSNDIGLGSASSSPTLDLLSANLVEQEGSEAVYPSVASSDGFVGGLKTVQERTGEVSERKAFDSSGGDIL